MTSPRNLLWSSSHSGPWFRGRPRTTLVIVGVLFAAVFTVRVVVGGADEAVAMLYTLPIALVAVAFGRGAGLAAGAVGVGLVATWAFLEEVSISPLGWAARVVPLLLLGGLLGDATDRLRRSEAERMALELAARRHRDAIEINDTIVQGMAAAKWSLEAGNVEGGLATLSETLRLSRQLVSELLRNSGTEPSGVAPSDVLLSAPRHAPDMPPSRD